MSRFIVVLRHEISTVEEYAALHEMLLLRCCMGMTALYTVKRASLQPFSSVALSVSSQGRPISILPRWP